MLEIQSFISLGLPHKILGIMLGLGKVKTARQGLVRDSQCLKV